MTDPFEMLDIMRAWDSLVSWLPERHYLLVTGPNKDGTYTVGVISNQTPTKQVAKGHGTLLQALLLAKAEMIFILRVPGE